MVSTRARRADRTLVDRTGHGPVPTGEPAGGSGWGAQASTHPVMGAASDPLAIGSPAPEKARRTNRRTIGLAVIIGSLAVASWPAAQLWLVLAGLTVAVAVGLPLTVADVPKLARKLVPVAIVLIALLSGWAAIARASGSGSMRDRTHDGGVLVTRAAADDIAHGRNPYADDFQRVLPTSWRLVMGTDGAKVGNPVRHHFPYLPAAAIVHVPFVAAADALGTTWDPRVLGWIALVAALIVLARRPDPAWMRLGAILGVGGAFSIVYLAWGTNDLFAVSLVVLALCWADERPGLAGVTLAVALSAKVLLLVLVPPLALAVFAAGGVVALKRWWTLPAVLAATCAPLFLVNPAAFIDDTIWFNLGKAKPLMPTSGLGLAATYPGLFHGPLLGLVTLAGLALAVALPLWAVRRWPSVWTAGAAAGIALLGVLVPARTFQTNYLVLVAALLPLAWLAKADLGSRPSTGLGS